MQIRYFPDSSRMASVLVRTLRHLGTLEILIHGNGKIGMRNQVRVWIRRCMAINLFLLL